jgi:diacylglycerol O-acyltransferase
MTTHPLSPVDAAWFHMDGPANLAMVTGVMLTAKPLPFDEVRAIYRQRMPEFDRFHQRVVERGFPLATPHWEDMPHFDIDQHLHHLALPAPHDQAALATLLGDIASTPLDHAQPLWQVQVVDGVESGSALITRYHHCMGDGTAMMMVIERLFDSPPAAARKPGPTPRSAKPGDAQKGMLGNALDALDVMVHPQPVIDKAMLVVAGAGALMSELFKTPDPKSPFKGDFGIKKHLAWSRQVAIKDVKTIGARYAAKVNDVLVAAMTGALRAYLIERGVDVNHTTVRAMVPVDLRPPEHLGQLGNEFGLVILDLPVTSARSAQRVALTKARMDALKHSPEPVAMQLLLDIFGRGPKALEDVANAIFGSKASLVMTNVAGPAETRYLAGVPIERMMFWVPHPGNQLGMGISILSYRGLATLSVIADAHLVPDPELITKHFNREFEAMLREVKGKAAKPPTRRKSVSTRSSTHAS